MARNEELLRLLADALRLAEISSSEMTAQLLRMAIYNETRRHPPPPQNT
jgi:hypothetical protein